MTTPSDTLSKIAALLRQAESTTHEAEAEAFVAKAQQLATLASIDLEVARSYTPAHERRENPVSRVVVIGPRGKKSLATYVSLYLTIACNNDVRCNIADNSTFVVAFGYPSDIDTTTTLYSSLVGQMVEASSRYIRTGSYRGEKSYRRVTRKNAWGEPTKTWAYAPVDGRIARRSFQEAFISRIGQRLAQARQDAIDVRQTQQRGMAQLPAPQMDEEVAETSVALVLRKKADHVKAYYTATSRARGSWKGSSGSGYSKHASHAGDAAGKSARIGAPRALGH